MKVMSKTARCLYATGIAALGIQQFIYADFRPVILPPWPTLLHEPLLACIAGAALIAAAACIFCRIRGPQAALLLGTSLLVLFIGAQSPYILFIQPYQSHHLGLWTDPLKELALSGGAFVMAGLFPADQFPRSYRNYPYVILSRLIPYGRFFFCITMISLGIDHFFYKNTVENLVPAWFPDHLFWTYFAGIALISSGVAIMLRIRMKKVAYLLSLMLMLWVILLHIPRAIASPFVDAGNEITSVFEALAFSGTALGIALMYRRDKEAVNIKVTHRASEYERIAV